MRDYEILLVDDDPLILKTIGYYLEKQGYLVTKVESGEDAVEKISSNKFDMVITDLIMNGINGIGVLEKAKKTDPKTIVMILTGYGDMTSAIDSLRLNADDYLLKPCDNEEIQYRVSRGFEKYERARKCKIYENILPVCCVCKKVRNDDGIMPGTGKWMNIEDYLKNNALVDVTSTYCPDCSRKIELEIDNMDS